LAGKSGGFIEESSLGAQWWQINVCGSDSSNNTLTPFSNLVSLGPVS